MSTITAGAVTPVGAPYNTSPAYSGTFIPTLWSAKLNAKFYTASTFADICNRDWEGEISNLGDKVIINNIPSISVSDYVVGGNLNYQTPTPNTIELPIDRAKYYAFNISDVLNYQAKPDLMDMFSSDASEQMRVVIDSTCLFRTIFASNAAINHPSTQRIATANLGATAGVKSGAYNLGTDTAPVQITSSTVLPKILEMASVLDEQNVPESGRWLLITPQVRTLLMQSNLAQAQYTGDDKSPVRNGLIGTIDRFKLYVTNNLPTIAASSTTWTSGDGSETVTGGTNANKRFVMLAGHSTGIAFASQMTKTETLRNPTDFGDVVRGLQVFGHRIVKPESLALLVGYV